MSAKETRYAVTYDVDKPKYVGSTAIVSLKEGYSDFEDIRKIIAIRRGLDKSDIKVLNVQIMNN